MAYNNLSVSIVASFLKHYGIRRLVLSPGMRNVPFVVAVETDPYFECYSVVDERNAAFFALGLSQQTGEAVGLACTSGTAVSNYLSGITEAFYSRTPLVAITCDRSPYVLNQLETQKIDQLAALGSVVRYSCALPVLKDMDDVWFFERQLSEAFIALRKGGGGPVHLNLPLVGDTNAMWADEQNRRNVEESLKFIDYVIQGDSEAWREKRLQLAKSLKIMMVLGQTFPGNQRLEKALSRFCKMYKCPCLSDNLSNFRCDEFVHAEAVMKGLSATTFEKLLPDIVITLGMNFQERIKDLFKAHKGACRHWAVDVDGVVRDCFKSQTALFHCSPEEFLEGMVQDDGLRVSSDGCYLSMWQKLESVAQLPELPYGNFRVVQEFCKVIPARALLHVSILNATRLVQFFDLPKTVNVFSNVSSFGIDGCLPTFMGQAEATEVPAFLVIGDISFFYAMNALSIKHRKNNVHILLINNGGAAEFHIPPTSNAVPTIDKHIGVAHGRTAKDWAVSQGYDYHSVSGEFDLVEAMQWFVRSDNSSPVLLEVFTNMKADGEFCLHVYRELEQKVNKCLRLSCGGVKC